MTTNPSQKKKKKKKKSKLINHRLNNLSLSHPLLAKTGQGFSIVRSCWTQRKGEGGQGSPFTPAACLRHIRQPGSLRGEFAATRKRVWDLIYSSNPLDLAPSHRSKREESGATIPSLVMAALCGGKRERDRERGGGSEIAAVIYLLRSDFSSLHHLRPPFSSRRGSPDSSSRTHRDL